MKILNIMPFSPIPPTSGSALRIYNILKNVVKHHEVTLMFFGNPNDGKKIKEEFGKNIKDVIIVPDHWQRKYKRLAQLYSTVNRHSYFYMQGASKSMQKMIDSLLAENEYDIIQTEFSHFGIFDLKTEAVKICNSHNVEYDNIRRMWVKSKNPLRKLFYYLEFKKLYKEELAACRKQDVIFTTSEIDKKLFSMDLKNIPMCVIPNGVDSTYFAPGNIVPEPYSLVFTGLMAYVPNYDGILYFLDEIFPLIQNKIPQVKIYIVGNQPPKHLRQRASTNIIITGYTEDVRPYVHRATVYVVPLRIGSGTRLKISEALSMKKPIVTTSIGCEGIDVISEESAIIADEPHAFAESVVKLLHNADLRRKLISNGYELMRTTYEWTVITEKVEKYYNYFVEENIRRTQASKTLSY